MQLSLRAAKALLVFTLLGTSTLVAQRVLTVINTNDGGPGSFREAIEISNSTAGADTIRFNISGLGPHEFRPTTPYPGLTESVFIDGYSQFGAVVPEGSPAVIKIVLNGVDLDDAPGLSIQADGCFVTGLNIINFAMSGITVFGNSNRILFNVIGVDITTGGAAGNGHRSTDGMSYEGVWIIAGAGNKILGNVISGNALAGIWIGSQDGSNEVLANFVGTDETGNVAVPNGYGIVVQHSPDNYIFGNLVSGNALSGIVIGVYDGSTVDPSGNVLMANYVGVTVAADDTLANAGDGIVVNAPGTTVGGTEVFDRNVVSGNHGNGISIVTAYESVPADGNVVRTNYVGLDVNGTAALPNWMHGILIQQSSNNLIGGFSDVTANFVSGNKGDGINIRKGPFASLSASNNEIRGNFIGAASGMVKGIGNLWYGINIWGSPDNRVANNTIVDNGIAGVLVWDDGATGNKVQGNYIGMFRTYDPGPNQSHGVDIFIADNNLVGGTGPDEGNYIENNGGAGVTVNESAPGNPMQKGGCVDRHVVEVRGGVIVSGSECAGRQAVAKTTSDAVGNSILRNYMRENAGPGIDLGRDGETANDEDDPDSGPNNLQNSPFLISSTKDGPQLKIAYYVKSSATSSAYPLEIEFFVNGGGGEGTIFLGGDTYATPLNTALAEFVPTEQIPYGSKIVATATDADGNTSEFSSATWHLEANAVEIAPDTLDFGDVEIGASKIDTIGILNHGSAAVTGTVAAAADFLGNGMEIKSGDGNYDLTSLKAKWIEVEFHPASVGPKQSSITITHSAANKPSPVTVVVTGRGVATSNAGIEVSPASYDFGDVFTGAAVEKTFVLKSTGTAALSGSVLDGTDFLNNGFDIAEGKGLYNLGPGAEKTIRVLFAPVDEGAKQGKLVIHHNSSGVPTPVEITVSGNGINKPPLQGPTLVAPANNATNVPTSPTLLWRSVVSADLYRVRLSEASDLSDPVLDKNQADTTASGLTLSVDTKYYWSVDALEDELVEPSDTWSFTTAPAPNTPPVAVDDTVTVDVGVESILLVLENDTDADGDVLEITGISDPPINGSASWSASEIRYTPNPGFTANDLLVYRIQDGSGGTDEASVLIRVTATTYNDGDYPSDVTELYQNYPNPFSSRTTFVYSLREAGMVEVSLLDVLGREIRTLAGGKVQRGIHQLEVDASGLPNGLYLVRMWTGETTITRQMSVVR